MFIVGAQFITIESAKRALIFLFLKTEIIVRFEIDYDIKFKADRVSLHYDTTRTEFSLQASYQVVLFLIVL